MAAVRAWRIMLNIMLCQQCSSIQFMLVESTIMLNTMLTVVAKKLADM